MKLQEVKKYPDQALQGILQQRQVPSRSQVATEVQNPASQTRLILSTWKRENVGTVTKAGPLFTSVV